MNKKETFVAGCRASGKLHIGNYLGLMTQLLETQNQEDKNRFYFIADLHGITTPFEPEDLSQNTLDVAASYLAAGINPDKTVFFLQSQVLEHANLAWIFNCIASLGELERMTQFKDKAGIPLLQKEIFEKIKGALMVEKNLEAVDQSLVLVEQLINIFDKRGKSNAGLLTYPTLMAADILLYKPTLIPVGEDQIQHVEFARMVARKFNNKFGDTFPEPKTYLQKPLRIMSLTDPGKKMSKTGDEALLLDDEPAEIMRKIKKAVTASESGKESPGEKNLMALLSHFGRNDEAKYFIDQQTNGTLKYSELKEALAKDIAEYFAEFREKKKELLSKPDYLAEVLGEGSRKAREVAGATLYEVKQKIGLL